ncbi:tetraspanin Pls1 family [Amanita rubescens]|nr:tetraspanin Pls1 family [Amanita rubescens]
MVSRGLLGLWAAFDFLLLAAGVLSISLSIVWKATNVLMNMVLSPSDLTAGMVLGVLLLLTVAISIAGIIQRNHVNIGLVMLNYALLVDAIVVVVIGGSNFHKLWLSASTNSRIVLQDQFKCCGYFNSTDAVAIGGNFCVSQDFVNGLNATVVSNFCVAPITASAELTLNTVYGFIGVILCLLLATLCVIKKREEEERFKRIDEKRGGRGFV